MATLEVTELPVRKWTQDYKEFLETLIKPESKVSKNVLRCPRQRTHDDACPRVDLVCWGCWA